MKSFRALLPRQGSGNLSIFHLTITNDPHPYSVGWFVGGGSLLFIFNIEATHDHRNNTRYDKDGFA